MKLLSSKCSFQGGRNYNEDSVLFEQEEKNAIAIVADGLGGHGCGEVASHIATSLIGDSFLANPVIDTKHLTKLFQNANRVICAEQKNGIKMKSTAVGWFYNGKKFAVAHIGDSRLYYFKQGKIVFQTKDHSVPQMLYQGGEITENEIRFHEDRNKILRALGSKNEIRVDIKIWDENLKTGDAFLLCSDGFWEYIWEDEMLEDQLNAKDPAHWLELMCERIKGRSTENSDNFSAVAIFVYKEEIHGERF